MHLKSDSFSFAFSWNTNKCLGFQKRCWPLAWCINSECLNEWKNCIKLLLPGILVSECSHKPSNLIFQYLYFSESSVTFSVIDCTRHSLCFYWLHTWFSLVVKCKSYAVAIMIFFKVLVHAVCSLSHFVFYFLIFFSQSVMNRMHVISIPYALMKVNPLSWIQKVCSYKGNLKGFLPNPSLFWWLKEKIV